MKLKLSLVSGTAVDDIVVTVDATATVNQLAERLRVSHPRVRSAATPGDSLCIRVSPGTPVERTVAPSTVMGEAGIRSGDSITLTNAAGEAGAARAAVATLRVDTGPDAGRSFALPAGTSVLGRDRSCDIRLADALVSKRHAKINVSDMVEIIDDNSANGIQVGDEYVQRAVVRSSDEIRIGDTTMTVTLLTASGAANAVTGHAIEFNRSPRLDPKYEGVELIAPEPPQRPQPQRFPLITMVAPLLMGVVMYSITKNALSIVFIALSPIMMVGSFFENRWATRRSLVQGAADFRASLRDLAVQLQYACDLERIQRRREHPSVSDVVEGVNALSPLTWTRRPEHESFGQVRLGLGTQPSRNTVQLTTTNNTTPDLWRELQDVAGQFSTVDRVPVVADLRDCGNIGIAGPAAVSRPLAAGVVAQFVGLHSPAELVIAAVCTASSAERWEWLKWLPHAGGEHSPLAVEHLISSSSGAISLIAAVEDLIAVRVEEDTSSEQRSLPMVVVIVDDEAATERARLVRIAERGPAVDVHLLWVAASLPRLPAACRAYLEVDSRTGSGSVGFVRGGIEVGEVELEQLDEGSTAQLARHLAPVVDAGAILEDQSDLPRTVSFLALSGNELAENSADVVELWRGTNSLPPEQGAPRLKRDNTLRALVGQAASDRFYLDLRTNGPHALVGGTTGAGKSEFLQSWILGMATAHSPARVNFLFIDYKGGAAFADCVDLPHCVGLVTDLSPHLVRRALRSLNAELRRREHILNRKRAKDLLELERRRDPEAPPSLVIVVDEFAALVQEVPEFVDGVVNVAQRGRSLGLHLILATQRPAGVIRDNLRANTNLRVALRMADENDSDDVIGTKQAATFDPSIPGRGVAKTGPGRLVTFQAAYVGGHTTNVAAPPVIDVNEFAFSLGGFWPAPANSSTEAEAPVGPNDIRRVVNTVVGASQACLLAEPLKPWLPDLATTYRLEQLPTRRTDDELVFGVIDRPDEQAQPVVSFVSDRDSNMAIFGTGGSGKSTALRTIAVAAGFSTARGGPCQVYALDYGARQLAMLEPLPHVGAVIYSDDLERTQRLLRMLRATVEERSERYSAVKANTIGEYRERSGNAAEPRLLLLIDNFGAFRQACDSVPQSGMFEMVERLAAEGRGVGVHLIATADRSAAFSAGMNSLIQAKLALRLASEMDYAVLGVPADVFSETSPPGRGYTDGSEVQIAVLGGEANSARQAAEIVKLAKAMERAGVPAAPPIRRLPEFVEHSSLPSEVGEQPTLGIWDETLEAIGFDPSGVFVVAGPPQSGRTTAVASLVTSVLRRSPGSPIALFAARRSTLLGLTSWTFMATDTDSITELARDLAVKIAMDDPTTRGLTIVIESVGALAGGLADDAVQSLIGAARGEGLLVIAEGETTSLSGWGLAQMIRADKYGVALQPDQMDGDTIFGTSLPRVRRTDFPPGRGYFFRSGRVFRVQLPVPDVNLINDVNSINDNGSASSDRAQGEYAPRSVGTPPH